MGTVLLAGDEASLYLQASLMRVWAPVGQTPVIKVDPGRDSTHFYGALNLQSGESGEEVVLQSALMKGAVSALFLNRVLLAYPEVPILLLWDRAPWHRGREVRAILEANARLEVLWLPAGSPELNPQEKVWKGARAAVSHNHTKTKLPQLAAAFERHLTRTRFACALLDKHGYGTLCAMFK